MEWNLYAQQPIELQHPTGGMLALAAVSPMIKGIAFWNADYLISAGMPGGTPGSGFGYTPVRGTPVYDEELGLWRIAQELAPDTVYSFYLPSERNIRLWEQYKQYVLPIEELHAQVRDMEA